MSSIPFCIGALLCALMSVYISLQNDYKERAVLREYERCVEKRARELLAVETPGYGSRLYRGTLPRELYLNCVFLCWPKNTLLCVME